MYQNQVGGQRQNPLATARYTLFILVYTVLALIGLIAGPAYAPLLFGLGGVSAALAGLEYRRWPGFDRSVSLIALLFLLLCGAGMLWTYSPRITAERLGQLVGITAGGLLLLTVTVTEHYAERLFKAMFWAVLAGLVILGADSVLDYPLQHALGGPAPNIGTKYNRGLIALAILVWPIAANLSARGQRRKAWLLVGAALLGSLVGLSATALAALAIGFAVWLAAAWAPRFAKLAVGGGMTILALALPLLLRLASAERPRLVHVVKFTGIHRLEIWDYMSARILERPLSGWGLGVAKVVPIHADELATYLYADATGIYPHNQWIELWLETGLAGVLLALGLMLVVLGRLQGRWLAYGLAAVAASRESLLSVVSGSGTLGSEGSRFSRLSASSVFLIASAISFWRGASSGT